jgi:hypothetical protein
LAGFDQVGGQIQGATLADPRYLCADGHPDKERLPPPAVLVRSLAVATALCPVDPAPAEFLEGSDRPVCDEHDVSPVSTIATVGTSAGDELLTAKAHHAVTTVTTVNDDLYTVYHALII